MAWQPTYARPAEVGDNRKGAEEQAVREYTPGTHLGSSRVAIEEVLPGRDRLDATLLCFALLSSGQVCRLGATFLPLWRADEASSCRLDVVRKRA